MNFNKKLMNLVKICLFMFTFLFISACSQTEKYETIEVFTIETHDDNQNEKGFFERTGYKIVNAITTIEEGKTEEGNTLTGIRQEPSTILITRDSAKNLKINNITEEEKAQVKEHVLAYMVLTD
jgi:hypothetical protein